jgi:hypothetical protein
MPATDVMEMFAGVEERLARFAAWQQDVLHVLHQGQMRMNHQDERMERLEGRLAVQEELVVRAAADLAKLAELTRKLDGDGTGD